MANSTKCQTPGAIFHTKITTRQISLSVDLPEHLELSEEQAEMLEANLHNAAELVLAPYFIEKI
jgi:hypothetical protein